MRWERRIVVVVAPDAVAAIRAVREVVKELRAEPAREQRPSEPRRNSNDHERGDASDRR